MLSTGIAKFVHTPTEKPVKFWHRGKKHPQMNYEIYAIGILLMKTKYTKGQVTLTQSEIFKIFKKESPPQISQIAQEAIYCTKYIKTFH